MDESNPVSGNPPDQVPAEEQHGDRRATPPADSPGPADQVNKQQDGELEEHDTEPSAKNL